MSLSFRTNGNFIDFVNTDATSLNVETLIVKLHNTSRCIDWSLPEDTTKISFTIDEVKYSNIPITEIDFDGTVMNSQDDFETGITAMFEGLAGGGSGGVESVTAGTNITLGGTATNPVINSTGGGVYKVAEVTVTDAQMKDWSNTPVVLLEGEAGKAKIVTDIAWFKNTAAGAYVTTNNNILVYYGNFSETSISTATPTFNSDVNEVGIRIAADNMLDEFENIDVRLLGTGDPYTGGNAANTIKFKVFYIEIDLT